MFGDHRQVMEENDMVFSDELAKSSSNSSGYETDFPDVSTIDDVLDAIDLCEQYDVPYDGLDEVEDFIERLTLHFEKEKSQESRKQQVSVNPLPDDKF